MVRGDITFQEFLTGALTYEIKRTRGAAIHNLLWGVRRDLAVRLAGSNIDPLQDDRRITACLDWLEVEWDK